MEIHLRALLPPDMVLVTDEQTGTGVTLPGEVFVDTAIRIEQIRGDIWAANQERVTAMTREAEAEARKGIADAYTAGATIIHELALERDPDCPPLQLTVTQIDAILQCLVHPVQRETLIAKAYADALGISEDEIDPLADGSSPSSSASGGFEDLPVPTGVGSDGESS